MKMFSRPQLWGLAALAFVAAPGFAQDQSCEIAGVNCDFFSGLDPKEISEPARAALNSVAEKRDSKQSDYVVLFDTTKKSSTKRFYLINLKTGLITAHLAAHGKGSDPDHDGWLDTFSDVPGSKATPRGTFRTAETYTGKHGYSLKLDGLEPSNANARSRFIVIHGADYVSPDRDPIGRSWGCPALDRREAKDIIDKIKEGAILVIH